MTWPVALAVGLILLASGCSTSASSAEHEVSERVKALSEDSNRQGWRSQASLLRDGYVSDAELRQARLDAISCMKRSGMTVTDVREVETSVGIDLHFVVHANGKSDSDGSRLSTDCERRFDLNVLAGYNASHTKLRPKALRAMRKCLREHGKSTGSASTYSDLAQQVGDRSVMDRCMLTASGG